MVMFDPMDRKHKLAVSCTRKQSLSYKWMWAVGIGLVLLGVRNSSPCTLGCVACILEILSWPKMAAGAPATALLLLLPLTTA